MDQERPLTNDEIATLRKMVIADGRAKWLMAIIRNSFAWLAVVVGGLVLSYEGLISLVKHLVGGK